MLCIRDEIMCPFTMSKLHDHLKYQKNGDTSSGKGMLYEVRTVAFHY